MSLYNLYATERWSFVSVVYTFVLSEGIQRPARHRAMGQFRYSSQMCFDFAGISLLKLTRFKTHCIPFLIKFGALSGIFKHSMHPRGTPWRPWACQDPLWGALKNLYKILKKYKVMQNQTYESPYIFKTLRPQTLKALYRVSRPHLAGPRTRPLLHLRRRPCLLRRQASRGVKCR